DQFYLPLFVCFDPTVMRSEGGVVLSLPRAEAGTMYGAATAAAVADKKLRRETFPLIYLSS
ncbi:MAG: hypothetical protein GWP08_08880, partial [Nitrospiraceae bacterium]|nr:hypothetical protein [Nitrospiraceae bacterium]